jgi:ketosteroid isomerase-like protein
LKVQITGTTTGREIVRQFLAAMEARDLEAAKAFLSTDFRMTFPGGVCFSKLEELVDWGKDRYQNITKSFDGIETANDNGEEVVFCFGTLAGSFPDGSSFQNVRFIDRFKIRDGKLCDQRVWNDLGEYVLKHSPR